MATDMDRVRDLMYEVRGSIINGGRSNEEILTNFKYCIEWFKEELDRFNCPDLDGSYTAPLDEVNLDA